MNDKLKLLLRVLVGVVIMLALCWNLDFNSVLSRLIACDLTWFLWVCLLAIVLKILKAYKWWLLLHAREVPISAAQGIRLYFEGNLVGALTPANVGSDIYRSAALSGFQQNSDVVSTLIIERLIGYTVLAATAALCIPFAMQYFDSVVDSVVDSAVVSVVWKIALGASVVLCALTWLLRSGRFDWVINNASRSDRVTARVTARLRSLWIAFSSFGTDKSLLLVFAFLSAIEVLILVALTYCAAWSLSIEIQFIFVLVTVPLVQILIKLPISFQAIGIQEGIYVYLFVVAGFSQADGLAVSLLLRVAELMLVYLPGFFMMLLRSRP